MGEDTGFAAFVRKLPCVGCVGPWWRSVQDEFSPPVQRVVRVGRERLKNDSPDWSEVAHLLTRGAGHGVLTRDGLPNIVPLCSTHHAHQEGATSEFETIYGVDLWAIAQLIADAFEVQRGQ